MRDCPICNESMTFVSNGDITEVICGRCGRYNVKQSAAPLLLKPSSLQPRQKANLSGWLYENQIYEINDTNFQSVTEMRTPSFHERADKLLIAIDKNTKHIGEFVGLTTAWLTWTWSLNNDELTEILNYLRSSPPRLEQFPGLERYKIAPEGWKRIEELKKVGCDSLQGFVAMWFDSTMQGIYDDAIAKAILDAGYKPHRVDQRQYNDKIDDEIIAQIRRSRFVVADFTRHRGGVYYEAGFAKGLGLEVFWTCEESDLPNLHFDIRQYNCIAWKKNDLDDFRKKLTNRIERVLGRGNYQSK